MTQPADAANKTIQQLRVGIMCRDLVFPAWQAETIRRVAEMAEAQIHLLIVEARTTEWQQSPPPIASRLRSYMLRPGLWPRFRRSAWSRVQFLVGPHVLWQMYRAIGTKLRGDTIDAPTDLSDLLGHVPQRRCTPILRGRYSQYFSESDIDFFRSCNLDIILRFAFGIIRGDILRVARYGVWSFHHDDHLKVRGVPPGFWEVYYDHPTTGVMLQRLEDRLDDGLILHKELFRTVRHSYTRNLDNIFGRSVHWPAAACRRILLNNGNLPDWKEPSSAPIFHDPTNRQMVSHIPRIACRFVKKQFRDLLAGSTNLSDHWTIGVIKTPLGDLLNPNRQPCPRWITTPPNNFLADPFCVRDAGTTYIFCEEYVDVQRKGRVVYIETTDWQSFSAPQPVLELPFHLSYPMVFRHDNQWLCIPEQAESGQIDIYRATSFPNRWEYSNTLLSNFAGYDPTVFLHNGRWWMTVTRVGPNHLEHATALYVFHADNVFGPWISHCQNPVVKRLGKVRPAGRIIQYQGRLIRPAQDCSEIYGGGLLFYQITTLSPDEYSECEIGCWLPGDTWDYPAGMHHFEVCDGFVVIDAKRYAGASPNPIASLLTKLKHCGRLSRRHGSHTRSRNSKS